MPTKPNGSGKQQGYDPATGRYGEENQEKLLPHQQKGGKIKMTSQEWALYYKALGDEKRGNHVYRTDDGYRLIRIETQYSNKIVIDDGGYIGSQIQRVYSFPTSDELSDAILYWELKGLIK